MEKQLDLGAFLAQQTGAGTVDSQGDFTVSHQQAARKMAKFALPRETAWVSLLVQAAVRWNCRSLQIKQSRQETLFYFDVPNLNLVPTEEAIVGCLLSANIGGRSALEAFCLALRALVGQARLSFILVADGGDMVPRPIYSGQHYGEISESARRDPRFSPKAGISLTVYHKPRKESDAPTLIFHRGGVAIVGELDRYCYMSPLPIFVDGRRVDGLLTSNPLRFSRKRRPLLVSGLRNLVDSPTGMPLPVSFEAKTFSLLSNPRRTLRTYGGRADFDAVFLLAHRLPNRLPDPLQGLNDRPTAQSHLVLVNDGVVVESLPLKIRTLDMALWVFVNASGLSTDLTGFTTIDDDKRRARLEEVMTQVGFQLCQKDLQDIDFFRLDRDDQSPDDERADFQDAVKQRIKVLVRGGGAGLAITLFNPLVGTTAALGAIAGAYYLKEQAQKSDPYLLDRDKVEGRLATDFEELQKVLLTTSGLTDEPPAEPLKGVEFDQAN